MGAGEVLRASTIMVGTSAAGASRRSLTSRALTRQAADDAVGILVELLDNALDSCGPPKLRSRSHAADDQDGGVVLQVQDSRSDMTGDEIAAANRVLTDPRSASTAFDGFGLLVAGCLAARHGIEVELAAKQAAPSQPCASHRLPSTAASRSPRRPPRHPRPCRGRSLPRRARPCRLLCPPEPARCLPPPCSGPGRAPHPRLQYTDDRPCCRERQPPDFSPCAVASGSGLAGIPTCALTGRPASPAAYPSRRDDVPLVGSHQPARPHHARRLRGQHPHRPATAPGTLAPGTRGRERSIPGRLTSSRTGTGSSHPAPTGHLLAGIRRRPETAGSSPEQPPAMPRGSQHSLFGDRVEQTRASMGNMLGGDQSRAAPSRPIRRETTGSAPVVEAPVVAVIQRRINF